ncbi:hypothetical protein [Nocardiopsis ganjiahuensis]|uniref:hypothetical protein n=1 Tax=Nocardiopsis ganjiahuensis TaxID=239984 RepID=UPI00126912EE|nr:hypothetical protein [Nocardiopsis ganjiahuensis]
MSIQNIPDAPPIPTERRPPEWALSSEGILVRVTGVQALTIGHRPQQGGEVRAVSERDEQ